MIGVWYLYAIRLPVNDYAAAYIGVSKRPRQRFTNHCHAPTAIGEVIRLCGRENVVFEILESGDREYIYRREIETIAALNTKWGGYNRDAGGHGCRDPLPSTRARMSASHKGKVLPAEQRAKISAANKGKKIWSAEQRAKISARVSGEGNPWFGKKLSSEHRARLLAANTGRIPSAEQRAKLSAANTGKIKSAENRAKLSAANMGKKQSQETCDKRSAALTAEIRARISAAMRGERNPNFGKPKSAETKAKLSASISAAKLGKPWSTARRQAYESRKVRLIRRDGPIGVDVDGNIRILTAPKGEAA